jgi:hypothetical protein
VSDFYAAHDLPIHHSRSQVPTQIVESAWLSYTGDRRLARPISFLVLSSTLLKYVVRPRQLTSSALGYLLGPTIGSMLYTITHPAISRGNPSSLEVMDRAFFDHIKANRASPAFQSVNNPAPDFYGEKVGLLSIVICLRAREVDKRGQAGRIWSSCSS